MEEHRKPASLQDLSELYHRLGYKLAQEEVEKVYPVYTGLQKKKKNLFDEDYISILEDVISGIPEHYSLGDYKLHCGFRSTPAAEIRLFCDDEEKNGTGAGDGPIDALYQAIDQASGFSGKLKDFTIRSVSSGSDALGEVMVLIRFANGAYRGKSVRTDIIEASIMAYLNALNRALFNREAES